MISYPHRIRLRGPWECDSLLGVVTHPDGRQETLQGALTPPRRVTMPCRWAEGGLAGFTGQARFRRRFGYPGRIDAYERVWLTFAGVTAAADIWLNGRFLGRHEEAQGPFEFEVSGLLLPRNELVVSIAVPSADGGLWDEVALEVRRTAFLRELWAGSAQTPQGLRLLVTGKIVGTSDRPLELYALLYGRTVIYATLEPTPEGRPFRLFTEPLDSTSLGIAPEPAEKEVPLARVELIDGAVVWYRAEVPLGRSE